MSNYYVYIVKNSASKFYIGMTSDVEQRLKKHNSSGSKWTKHKGPWELVYQEQFENKKIALQREKKIKSYKGGNAFKNILRRGVRAV